MPGSRATRGLVALITAAVLSCVPALAAAEDDPGVTPTAAAETEPTTDESPGSPGSPGAPESPESSESSESGDRKQRDPREQRADDAVAAADVPPAQVGVTKTNSLEGAPLTPGAEFLYTVVVRCSGLEVGCVNQTFTDVLPEGLDVTSLPTPVPGSRTVDYDAPTRTLTVRFVEPLQEPVGAVGLNDGATRTLEIGMRLPASSPLTDGTVISNTATTVADNAPAVESTSDVTVSVPREVRPVVTKDWADGSAVAGSGETSTLTLGVRNNSSSSAAIQELFVTDADQDTFEHFDLAGVEVTAWPAGADRARLWVCTEAASACAFPADYEAGPPASSLGSLELPAAVPAGDVTGLTVVFDDADGQPLPYDATGGTVRAELVLRDTYRSSGDALRPTSRIAVDNCATPGAVDDRGATTTGATGCDRYDILPDTVLLEATKSYRPDTDGDFNLAENGEYAVLDRRSPVSATVSVRNRSAFPLREVRIVEPDAGPASEFEKLDVTKVRLRLPSGATNARLVVSYADGSADLVADHTGNQTVDVTRAGTRVTRVEVVYTGVDGEGRPSIAIDATAGLDLHGTLTDAVTEQDVIGGVGNCASYDAKASTSNSTGTASGVTCDTLPVEEERMSGDGVKSVSQTQLPPGEPVQFTLRLTNDGNVPLVDPVISDPRVDGDGRPRTDLPSPFELARIVSASVSDSGGTSIALQVFDPQAAGGAGAWVAYSGADSALLERATGLRAAATGELRPTRRIVVELFVQRRDGAPDGATLANCFDTGALDWSGDPACAPQVVTGPATSGAVINKAIQPGQLVRPLPGVDRQTAEVRMTIANTGNTSANRLQLVDDWSAFFDAVDLGQLRVERFPRGANRVRVDALVDGTWVAGSPVPSAGDGAAYPLPAGVDASDVTGVRVTFTSSSGGYDLRPCEGSPTPTSCTGVVEMDVHPRVTLRSAPDTPVPDQVVDRLVGGYETRLQNPGELDPVDPVEADLTLTEGEPELDVAKTPDSAIAPGETAPFRLTVTNTGTANLPGLVVRDLLPPGLTFDESFNGDTGYRIVDALVPAGTEPVPAPTFTTTSAGGRVTGLRWEFGDWLLRPSATFVIEIQVRLAPGVTEGQAHENLMGATADDPGLDCAPGTGEQAGDGSLGEGTWCTDTAAVSTKAGAAFEARKWVAGRDELGWWDNRARRVVPVGDAACPSRTQDGRTFTAFPCVALVNPGDRYDYLLTFVNSGTEPATEMRVVDRFPVEGDKGVVLSALDRGTQWQNRPTLATEPTLLGPGAMSVAYAGTEADLCTDDLAMTDGCAAGTWDAGFGPEVVGVQMRVDWGSGTPLPPGGEVAIRFQMDTPLDVPRVADPTIAWNSFGHAERTLRSNGQSRVLPPTEPIKVGVATAYGSLEVAKEIGDNPAGLPLDDRVFEIDYRCTIDPVGGPEDRLAAEGTLSLRGGESQRVDGIPAGATCEVWEDDALGGVTSAPAGSPEIRTIAPALGEDRPQRVTVTNDYPLASVAVEKRVRGGAAVFGEQTAYPVEVTCTWQGVTVAGFPRTVTLVGNDTETVEAPVGAVCTAAETDTGGATRTAVEPADGVVVAADAETLELVVTNTFERGHLRIRKEITGAGADLPEGPFEFAVDCTFEGAAIPTETVVLERAAGATELEAEVDLLLPVGAACTVSETGSGGADTTPPDVTLAIVENDQDNTVTATFVNEYSAGTIAVSKALAGAGADQPYAVDATFTVLVTCAVGEATQVVFSDSVDIRGGERVQLEQPGAAGEPVLLPLGSRCWAEETATGGATSHAVNADSFDSGLEVVAGTPDELQELELEVTNTFDLASYTVDKTVDGDAAAYAEGREFTVAVTCVLPQNGVRTPLLTAEEHTLTDDEPVVVEALPVGAECWVAETGTGGATSTDVEHQDQAGPAVVAAGSTTTTAVTNTFDAAELVVGKRVVDGPVGPYSFELACTTDQGEVSLAPGDAEFRLRDGRTRTVSVPLGAECEVVETDVPDEAEVTFEASDRGDDGVVTVAPAAEVTVVNTFPEADTGDEGDEGDDDRAGDLPDTGGFPLWQLFVGGGMVLAGAVLVLRRRLRPAA